MVSSVILLHISSVVVLKNNTLSYVFEVTTYIQKNGFTSKKKDDIERQTGIMDVISVQVCL